ncbi:MAG TPA: DUF5916 domain-containing protein [Terriglobia bacterium]
MRRYVATAAILLLVCARSVRAQSPRKPAHTLHAYRTDEKIAIDGILNDPVWKKAPIEWDFTQRDPIEGVDPSERTEIQVVYDESSIYFGVRMFDREPEKIVRQLSRRDDVPDADYFILQLSPNHDQLTGALFQVSAAGVQRDAIISNDNFQDQSWDGVWESATHIGDDGWSLEIRIPFSQLRFPRGDRQVWGINAARYIHRKNETVWLQMVPKNDTGTASRMDNLDGLDSLDVHRHLDLTPYLAAQANFVRPTTPGDPFNSGRSFSGMTGLDLKYGVRSNMTLDATVNPDFGQVQVDPAVVNISQFETFFQEKRPFFLEGANIFGNFGQGGANSSWGFNRNEPNLFYSRRLGRAPEGTVKGSPAFVDLPQNTQILGAGKLTGKTRNGWTVGLVEGLTARDYADVANRDPNSGVEQKSKAEVEPLTNYMVGRVLREWNRGGVGFLTTAVNRDLRDPGLSGQLPKRANIIGGDGYWFLDSKKSWVLTARVAGSSVGGSTAAMNQLQQSPQHYFQRPDASEVRLQPELTSMRGWQGDVNLNRQLGDVIVNAALWGVSPGFESNDLGFQTGGDGAGEHTVVFWRKTTPDRFSRSRNVWVANWQTWDFGRKLTGSGWNSSAYWQFMNYWSISANAGGHAQVRDDQLTRGGPAALNLPGHFAGFGLSSDSRKKVSFNPYFNMASNKPHAWSLSGNVGINYKPNPSITINTSPGFDRSRTNAQYVKAVADPTATRTYGSRYVFGEIDQFDVNLTTQVNWVLSPYMSLAVFAQPLISVARYWDIKELAQPDTYSFLRYGHEIGQISYDPASSTYTVDPDNSVQAQPFTIPDPNFNFKSMRVNAIFRWDWHLGSTLYLVWTENRQDNSNPGYFSAGHDISHLLAHPDDVFLVRLAYWFSK